MRRLITIPLPAILAIIAACMLPGVASASPSEQIAFARQLPDGGANIYIADPNGANETQVPLAYPAEDWAAPHWSPDRQQLLISNILRFDGNGDLLPFRAATVNLDGSEFNLLDEPGAPFDSGCFGGWYDGGARLLCGYGDELAGVVGLRASDGGDPVRLTTYPFGANCNSCDQPTDVSPDGNRFVFLRFKNENSGHQQVALFVENLDGTGLRQITAYGVAMMHEVASARWSPDGRRIIFTANGGRLATVRPDGTGLRPINLKTGDPHYFAFAADYSPDGSRIVFSMFRDGQEDLYTANPDGSELVQVTDTPDFENAPDWGPSAD